MHACLSKATNGHVRDIEFHRLMFSKLDISPTAFWYYNGYFLFIFFIMSCWDTGGLAQRVTLIEEIFHSRGVLRLVCFPGSHRYFDMVSHLFCFSRIEIGTISFCTCIVAMYRHYTIIYS